MRALRRGAVALAGVLLASGGIGLAGAPDAGGRPVAGACTDTVGITVIVDFGSAGGGVQTRCAPAPVKNGFEALTKAGFAIRNVSSQPGFLCQIDGKPQDETCSHVPSVSRYWSYWYAQRGESWTYSSSGGSRTPPPGSVEGWSFGSSDPPGAAPPGPITTTPTHPPTPTTAAPSPTAGAGPSTTVRSGDALASSSTVAGTARDADDGGTTTTSQVAGGSAGSGPDVSGEQAAQELDPTAASDGRGGGSPVGALVGGAVVLALGGAVAVTARRRRAADEAGAS